MEQDKINWTRVNSDVNGNPRYVCHFFNLLTTKEIESNPVSLYQIAVKRANKIGGRKFHNKQYGGGIVFSSYSLKETEQAMNNLLASL